MNYLQTANSLWKTKIQSDIRHWLLYFALQIDYIFVVDSISLFSYK